MSSSSLIVYPCCHHKKGVTISVQLCWVGRGVGVVNSTQESCHEQTDYWTDDIAEWLVESLLASSKARLKTNKSVHPQTCLKLPKKYFVIIFFFGLDHWNFAVLSAKRATKRFGKVLRHKSICGTKEMPRKHFWQHRGDHGSTLSLTWKLFPMASVTHVHGAL